MLLAVDIGNTQTHLGAFQNGNLLEHWRLTTERDVTADELASIYTNLLALRKLSFDDIDDVIISSTVPKIVPEYVEMTERYLGEQSLVEAIGGQQRTPALGPRLVAHAHPHVGVERVRSLHRLHRIEARRLRQRQLGWGGHDHFYAGQASSEQ